MSGRSKYGLKKKRPSKIMYTVIKIERDIIVVFSYLLFTLRIRSTFYERRRLPFLYKKVLNIVY